MKQDIHEDVNEEDNYGPSCSRCSEKGHLAFECTNMNDEEECENNECEAQQAVEEIKEHTVDTNNDLQDLAKTPVLPTSSQNDSLPDVSHPREPPKKKSRLKAESKPRISARVRNKELHIYDDPLEDESTAPAKLTPYARRMWEKYSKYSATEAKTVPSAGDHADFSLSDISGDENDDDDARKIRAVWKVFTQRQRQNIEKMICNICQKGVSSNSRRNLLRHIEDKHPTQLETLLQKSKEKANDSITVKATVQTTIPDNITSSP